MLSDIDRVNQGVLATTMGAALFTHMGYEHLDDVHVEGDKEALEGMSLAVLRYNFESQTEPRIEI